MFGFLFKFLKLDVFKANFKYMNDFVKTNQKMFNLLSVFGCIFGVNALRLSDAGIFGNSDFE